MKIVRKPGDSADKLWRAAEKHGAMLDGQAVIDFKDNNGPTRFTLAALQKRLQGGGSRTW